MRPVADVLCQHADEAAFLWELRGGAVVSPHHNLADLTKLDRRIEANWDGLRIAGEAGWEICREALSAEEPGEIFAAAVLAFESGYHDRLRAVLSVVGSSQELSEAIVSALGWLGFQQAEPHLKQLLASSSSVLRGVGIAAFAIHRENPGPALIETISGDVPIPKARALRAVGELGLKNMLPQLQGYLDDQDDACRFWAAWSAALLSDDSKPFAILRSVAEQNLRYSRNALQVAVRRMDATAAVGWRNKLAQDRKLLRIAISVAGAFGDPESIPWLIQQMKTPQLARVSGEAFTMITGVDIAYEDLDGEALEGFESSPSENPEDENVEMDLDDKLPWPNPELISKWWSGNQHRFQKGTRYLMGKPITVDWMWQVLRFGRQRQRAAAALELAIRQPGQALFNVKAPGFLQQQFLGNRH